MRRSTALALALLVGCSTGTTSTTSPPPQPTATQATTTTTTPAPTSTLSPTTTSTTEPSPTTTTEAPPPPDGAPAFAITQVSFGEGAFAQITNVGTAVGDPGGHWLCQRPVYFEIPSVELGPGQSVWISVEGDDLQFVGDVVGVIDAGGRIGSLSVTSGEMALYTSNDFSNPDAIVDYVEWGTAGHGRSSVAVSAAIWPEGGFVATTEDTIAITAGLIDVDDPAAWAPDIGV